MPCGVDVEGSDIRIGAQAKCGWICREAICRSRLDLCVCGMIEVVGCVLLQS